MQNKQNNNQHITKQEIKPRAVNKSNLMDITITDLGDKDDMPNTRITTLNVGSVKNKDQIILQELNNNNINDPLITET